MKLNAKQKFLLAKASICITALAVTIVLLMYMTLEHNPKTIYATMDLHNQKIEFSVTFTSEKKEE